MKRTLISFLAAGLICFSGLSQQVDKSLFKFDNEKYDKEYFLIGMVNEIWRRHPYKGHQIVDYTMSKIDLKYFLFIDSLFNLDYSDITIVNNGGNFRLSSPTLARKIGDFYIYEATMKLNIYNDTMYDVRLKKEKFETQKQKLSFILGAYVRHGKKMDTLSGSISWYKSEGLLDVNKNFDNLSNAILMHSVWEEANFYAEVLTDFNCNDIEYVNIEMFPSRYYMFFVSSEKIQEVIREAERLNREIETINMNQVNFTTDGTKYIKDGQRP